MANTVVTGKYHSKGYNDSFQFYVEHTLTADLANADTLDLTLPEGVDEDSLPIHVMAWGPETAGVRTLLTNVALTTHNKLTKTTRLTMGGAVLTGATIFLGYTHR